VSLCLAPEEPEAGPWHAEPLTVIAATVMRRGFGKSADHRPVVLAVDGRSSSGKTTVAGRLQDVVAGSAVVHTDERETERRNLVRIGQPGGSATVQHLRDWMAEEIPFLAGQRPWARAGIIACGTPQIPFDLATELVVAPPLASSVLG
jgi:hypothetical protein